MKETLIIVTSVALAFALIKISNLTVQLRTDIDTGCLTKRYFARLIRKLCGEGKEFSMIVVDLANFKAANEKLGHLGGDRLLATIAGWLLGETAFVYRTGGDEFVLYAPGATRKETFAMRDRIEQRVGERFIAPRVAVFLAAEVTTWSPGDDFEKKLTEADFGLERRKKSRKRELGLPLTREETLLRVAA